MLLRPAAGDHASVQLAGPQLLEAPFNASELAPVKVMLEGADDGLDIAGDAPELADRLLASLPGRVGALCSAPRAAAARLSVAAIRSA